MYSPSKELFCYLIFLIGYLHMFRLIWLPIILLYLILPYPKKDKITVFIVRRHRYYIIVLLVNVHPSKYTFLKVMS